MREKNTTNQTTTATPNNQQQPGRKKPKVSYDKRGNALVGTAFRCPLTLWEAMENEAAKNDMSLTQHIIRILKKAHNVK